MKSKIIGKGLLAKAFKNAKSDKCLFFCSGVSNSNEVFDEAFKREESLLIENLVLNTDKCFVYFSSILAPLEGNLYFKHKMRMEKLISIYSSNYLIFRLPQVAGEVLNTTLLPTFTKNIYKGENFLVYKNAERTIIDVDDIVEFFDVIYSLKLRNKIINLCPNYTFKPETLISLISTFLQKEAYYNLIDGGVKQDCLISEDEVGKLILDYFNIYDNYLEKVVYKYVPKIVNIIISQENFNINSKN